MDNVTILMTSTMKEVYQGTGVYSLVMAVIYALCFLAFIYLIVKQIQYKEKWNHIVFSVMLMILAGLGWYNYHYKTHAILDETRPAYKVEINDETRMKEFYETYEVVDVTENGTYIVLPVGE